MQVVQQSSNVVSHVIDKTTDVADAVTTGTAGLLSGVPVVGTIAAQAADEFNFQINNVANLIDDQQAAAGDLLDLGQFISTAPTSMARSTRSRTGLKACSISADPTDLTCR